MKKIFVLTLVLLLCFAVYLYAQKGEATILIGDHGHKITIGANLDLTNNILSAILPSGSTRSYDVILVVDPVDTQKWALPVGATNVEVFRNRIRMIKSLDYNIVGDFVVFDSVNEVEVVSTDLITANFDL